LIYLWQISVIPPVRTRCNRLPGVSRLTIGVLDTITTVLLHLYGAICRVYESERCDGAVSF